MVKNLVSIVSSDGKNMTRKDQSRQIDKNPQDGLSLETQDLNPYMNVNFQICPANLISHTQTVMLTAFHNNFYVSHRTLNTYLFL